MNINQLKYFIAVAESQNFTRAAEQFFISQTAITQQIKALEETLDVQLFDRTKRPIALTPAGKVFRREAKAVIERFNSAAAKTRAASTGVVGELRLGYTKGYEKAALPDMMRSFHASYPNILITCFRDDTDELAAGLKNDKYDVIFTWDSTDIQQEDNINVISRETFPLMVALFADHPFAYKKALTRFEIKNEAIIYMSPSRDGQSYGDRRYYEQYRNAGYMPNIVQISNDIESINIMVAAGVGISILPEYATRRQEEGHVVYIPLVGTDEHMEIISATKTDNGNPALQNFLDWFEDYKKITE